MRFVLMPKIILASASPRRQKLMSDAGYNFEVLASGAEEISEKFMVPAELTV